MDEWRYSLATQDEPTGATPPRARVPGWKRTLAVPMLLLTAVYALAGGVLVGVAIVSWLVGTPFLVWESRGEGSFRVSGWGTTLGAALLLIGLASLQNRVRRRMLNPRAPRPARPRSTPQEAQV